MDPCLKVRAFQEQQAQGMTTTHKPAVCQDLKQHEALTSVCCSIVLDSQLAGP